jgi:hypothetical protein
MYIGIETGPDTLRAMTHTTDIDDESLLYQFDTANEAI